MDKVIVPPENIKLSTSTYPAIYWDGEKTWDGSSGHPQSDTGLGFTCDEKIVEIVREFNLWGITTLGSCQNTTDSGIKGRWYIPRAWIGFTHEDTHLLLNICLHIKKSMGKVSGWSLDIDLSNYTLFPHPYASVTFTEALQDILIDSLQSIPSNLREHIRILSK